MMLCASPSNRFIEGSTIKNFNETKEAQLWMNICNLAPLIVYLCYTFAYTVLKSNSKGTKKKLQKNNNAGL